MTGREEEGRGRLTVQVIGGGGEPERLLLLYRDGAESGRLLVKEWSSANPEAPREYEMERDDLYDALEDAQRGGRRVSQELHRVRRWLDGEDV